MERDSDFVAYLLAAANMGYISAEERDKQAADRLGIPLNVWAETLRKGDEPHEALLNYVAELRRRGYTTSILSNTSIGTLEHIFSPEQLDLFDELVVSAEVQLAKPDPRIYELASARLEVSNHECVFTDDNESNVLAAETVGMKVVHYKHFAQFKTALEAILAKE